MTSPTGPGNLTPTVTGTGVTTYTYTTSIRPIVVSDCTPCHNASQHQAGVDLSTYAGVMRVVAAGNASSVLVMVTQPGALMYGELSGDRTSKAGIIYDWVVNSGAAQ